MRRALCVAVVAAVAACSPPAAQPSAEIGHGAQVPLVPAAAAAIFAGSVAEVDVAAAGLGRGDSLFRPAPPVLVGLVRGAAAAAFRGGRIVSSAASRDPALTAAEAHLAAARQAVDTGPLSAADPALAALATRLPDTRLSAERGLVGYRVAEALTHFPHRLPRDQAQFWLRRLPALVPPLVSTTRRDGMRDLALPGAIAATKRATDRNAAALARLSPADRAALAWYATPAGARATDALVAAYAKANDAAAATMFMIYFSKALPLFPLAA